MIHDSFKNISRYDIPMLKDIVAFLEDHDPLSLTAVEIEIKGRELFVRPSQYQTRFPEEGRFETHDVYADLQYVVSGGERMEMAPPDVLTAATVYDPQGDIRFFTADKDITGIVVRSGEFAVFFPGEAHRPMCQRGLGPEAVKKLVFKIKIK
jgi:YhcH/YjgK/YiaL family protein